MIDRVARDRSFDSAVYVTLLLITVRAPSVTRPDPGVVVGRVRGRGNYRPAVARGIMGKQTTGRVCARVRNTRRATNG